MASRFSLLALALFSSVSHAWLPDHALLDKRGFSLFDETSGSQDTADKRWVPVNPLIRGVNLGSLFICEPWMIPTEWSNMGCGSTKSEFDCVMSLGQDKANAVFQTHWTNFINDTDLDEMTGYGINTIRVSVGYWMYEDLIDSSEHFPRGGLEYLTRLVGWASDRGMYIILDLHGAPGAQVAQNPFTGQYAPTAGFYNDYNYGRAVKFLQWLTNMITPNGPFRNVGMIEVVNEPLTWNSAVDSLRSEYYVNAYNAIRSTEQSMGKTANNYLHIQMMGSLWGSGDPTQYLGNTYFTAFDDHRYLKWDTSVAVTQDAYIAQSCKDDRESNTQGPNIVGEFSLSVPDDVQWTAAWTPSTQQDFYRRWFAAQVHAYETKTAGWVFWAWKTEGDYRWSYKDAVAAGVIPTDLNSVESVC